MVIAEITEYLGRARLVDEEELPVIRLDLTRLARTTASRVEGHFGM
ncbi:hypothetical protein [Streptomyces sp. NPDC048442]